MDKKPLPLMLALTFAAALAVPALAAAPARAKRRWAKNHPRRAEVNGRLSAQNRRIARGVKNGTMTKGQARQARRSDRRIRREERRMASRQHGRITKAQKRRLNRQENRNSRRIYKDKHAGAASRGQSAPQGAPDAGAQQQTGAPAGR